MKAIRRVKMILVVVLAVLMVVPQKKIVKVQPRKMMTQSKKE